MIFSSQFTGIVFSNL